MGQDDIAPEQGVENHLYILAIFPVAAGSHGFADQMQATSGIFRIGKLGAHIAYHVEE